MITDIGLGFIAIILSLAVVIVAWIILSIPVYISARVLTMGRIRFTTAMLASLIAPLLYFAIVIGSLLLIDRIGMASILLALIVAPIAWLWVYKHMFNTGWLRALGITVLSLILFIVLAWMVSVILGIALPDVHIPNPTPIPLHNI
jgi:hypothetical protein